MDAPEEVAVLADEFDIVVLGGGSAGYATALYGAAAGLNIALVEEGRIGGTCLHRGCIPAKELLQTADVLRTVQDASEFGIDTGGEAVLDLGRAQVRKQDVVDRLTSGLETLLKGRNVTVVPGRGEVVDGPGHRVRVADGTELAGRNLVVATGSAPRALPGLDFDGTRILSSDHVLELTEVPPRVAIIGGGVIGAEFASMLIDMGSEVTVLEALPRILATTDREVGSVVARSFKKRGVNVVEGARITGIDGARELTVSWETDAGGAQSVVVDKVIVSIGRAPRSSGIGLEAAGVGVDDRGFVVVNENLETNVAGVFAAGDVIDAPQLAHVGFAEGINVVKTVLGEHPTPIDYEKVPWVIYCRPEVASCGLTEEQAQRAWARGRGGQAPLRGRRSCADHRRDGRAREARHRCRRPDARRAHRWPVGHRVARGGVPVRQLGSERRRRCRVGASAPDAERGVRRSRDGPNGPALCTDVEEH